MESTASRDVELIKEFVRRLINLENQKLTLNSDIKQLKAEYAEQGVAVKMVSKALAEIKRKKKTPSNECSELEYLIELISRDPAIDSDISALLSR